MFKRYKVSGTTDEGRECTVDSGASYEQAAQWADRFKADGKKNVIMQEIEDNVPGQPSKWIAW